MVARVCMLAGILLILCGLRLKICPLDFGANMTKPSCSATETS